MGRTALLAPDERWRDLYPVLRDPLTAPAGVSG